MAHCEHTTPVDQTLPSTASSSTTSVAKPQPKNGCIACPCPDGWCDVCCCTIM